jgi:hypothetical protein
MKSTAHNQQERIMSNPAEKSAVEKVECPLDNVVKFLDRFVIFPSDEARDTVALWVVHTWAFDAAYTTPYIYIDAPDHRDDPPDPVRGRG